MKTAGHEDENGADRPAAIGFWARLGPTLPYLLAAGLFALGLYALYRLLAPVNLADVAAQIRATPWTTLALAMTATLLGYLSLAGYDWSALRYIGKPLPIPVVLTGGLMAYAFGNTIGLTAVSGGAVRWRLYSGLGLDGYDVAAVSTFAAVSFGVAATLVGLGALALHPGALASILPFPAGTIRAAAVGLIAVQVVPLFWASARGSSLRIRGVALRVPSLPILAGQILFSLGDIGFSALTLYLFLPAGDLGFFTFLAVFAAATMAGIISHVPGGIGVFETVVIAAMPPGTPVGQVAAALLLYRLVYYLLPFLAALVVLALYETWRAAGGRVAAGGVGRALVAVEPGLRAVAPVAPPVLAAMVFGSGVWMSFSALIPPLSDAAEAAEALFPLAFVEGSALVSSAVGAVLILLSFGILRRSSGAFWLTIAALAAGIVVALVQGLDWERATGLLLVIVLLSPFRHGFHRRATLTHAVFAPGWIALVLATLAAFGFVLVFAHRGTPYAQELWWQFALDARAPRALRAALVASLILGLAALWLLLRAPALRAGPPGPDDLARAATIVAGSDSPDAGFALTGDKTLVFSDDGRGLVMFGAAGRSWLAFGGPVGPRDAAEAAAQIFVDAARRAGARPVFYEVGAEDVPLMLDLGLALHKMGEEAVVDLSRFSLDGPGHRKLRAAHARALRDGLTLELVRPPHDAALIEALRRISDDWLAAKKTREKGFSVGRFDPAWLDRSPLALVHQGGRTVAFANVLFAGNGRCATLDLMRHSGDAPPGTMEFLFSALMLHLKGDGVRTFSLGMAPLSGLAPERSRKLWDRFGALIYRHGGHFYNFEGLRAFKDKFDPDWRPRYLAAPSSLPPLLPIADAARLINAGAKGLAGPAEPA